VRPCNENIKKTLALVEEMLAMAANGSMEREDTSCGILYGVLLDSAYKVKKLAEKEKENHIKKGWWNPDHE